MKLNSLLIAALSVTLAGSGFAGTAAPDTSKGGKCCQPVAPAADEGLGFTVGVGYDTDYIFRGVEFARHLVSGSIDYVMPITPALSLDLNAWYGASAGDHAAPFAGGGSYGELDLSAWLQYEVCKDTKIGVKYTWYDYVGNAGKTVKDISEVGITITTKLYDFDLGAGAYYDWTAAGEYYEASVSRTFEINSWLSIQPGVLVSFASHYYGVSGGNHVKPWLAFPIKLSKTATLTPYVAGNLPYGSLNNLGEKKRVYGGVALSVTF
jgi:hypothetical protein